MYRQTSIAQPASLARTAEPGLTQFGRALRRRAVRFGRLFMFALHESRRLEAARQIAKYRYLTQARREDGP